MVKKKKKKNKNKEVKGQLGKKKESAREKMIGQTIGVSPNIIEASFKALIDSLDYKLYKEKAPANK